MINMLHVCHLVSRLSRCQAIISIFSHKQNEQTYHQTVFKIKKLVNSQSGGKFPAINLHAFAYKSRKTLGNKKAQIPKTHHVKHEDECMQIKQSKENNVYIPCNGHVQVKFVVEGEVKCTSLSDIVRKMFP